LEGWLVWAWLEVGACEALVPVLELEGEFAAF
jgi:hypothetical protein